MDDLISRGRLNYTKFSVVNDNDYRIGWNECIDAIIDTAPTVITIPDNHTNGDMIKALFPNQTSDGEDSDAFLKLDDCVLCTFPKWWWNAPYKKGAEQ